MTRSAMKLYSSFFLLFCFAVIVCQPEAAAQRIRVSRGDRNLVISKLDQLKKPMTVHLYTGGGNANKTRQTLVLLEFMEEMSDKLNIVEHDMDKEPSLKADLGVEHGPVMALKGETFQGHSYYGLPSQMELEPFLDGILIAAGQGQQITPQAELLFEELEKEVHIKVFVTPD